MVSCSFVHLCCVMTPCFIPISPFHFEEMIFPLVYITYCCHTVTLYKSMLSTTYKNSSAVMQQANTFMYMCKCLLYIHTHTKVGCCSLLILCAHLSYYMLRMRKRCMTSTKSQGKKAKQWTKLFCMHSCWYFLSKVCVNTYASQLLIL